MSLQNKDSQTQKRNLLLPGGRDSQGVWEGLVHNTIFKMDNQQGPTLQHAELFSMLCASLDRRGVWGRMDTYVCMAESLCCSPETTTTLLTGQAIPQHKIKSLQFEKNKIYTTLKKYYLMMECFLSLHINVLSSFPGTIFFF